MWRIKTRAVSDTANQKQERVQMCVKTRFPLNKQTERNVLGNYRIISRRCFRVFVFFIFITRLASGEYTDNILLY